MSLAAIGHLIGTGTWVSGSVFTNPLNGDVVVDTGALGAGEYLFAICGGGSVAYTYDAEHRNAANDANIDAQRRYCAAGNEDFIFPCKLTLAANQRLRVSLVGNITGALQLSIFVLEVG